MGGFGFEIPRRKETNPSVFSREVGGGNRRFKPVVRVGGSNSYSSRVHTLSSARMNEDHTLGVYPSSFQVHISCVAKQEPAFRARNERVFDRNRFRPNGRVFGQNRFRSNGRVFGRNLFRLFWSKSAARPTAWWNYLRQLGSLYRGTSLIRNSLLLGPYGRTMPRAP